MWILVLELFLRVSTKISLTNFLDKEEITMKRINMAKYGFIRTPDDDFSDDGNRFTCYQAGEYENIRISKLVSDGRVYLSSQVLCRGPICIALSDIAKSAYFRLMY